MPGLTSTGGDDPTAEEELAERKELQARADAGDRGAYRELMHRQMKDLARARLFTPHDATTGAPVKEQK